MIPVRANLALLAVGSGVAAGCLWAASHGSWPVVVVAAVGFSYANHLLFALLHEAVHGVLHPDPRVNRWLGRYAAAWFPTSFTLQRTLHHTHHRNNRGAYEQFDYLRPGDRRWLKLAQWYAILTGVYWVFVPALAAVVAVAPGVLAVAARGPWADQTSASAYLDLEARGRMRFEAAGAFAFQTALFWVLGGSVVGWAACYGAFAVNWSSLQYADHAFSPLDRLDGAWDLRVVAPIRWVLLNYPLHRAHHRHPEVPWVHLPRYVDPEAERPRFLAVWLAMWRGPRPLP